MCLPFLWLLEFSSSFPSHALSTLGSVNSVNSDTTAYSFCSLPTVLGYPGVFPGFLFLSLLFFSVFKHSLIYSLAILFITEDWRVKKHLE